MNHARYCIALLTLSVPGFIVPVVSAQTHGASQQANVDEVSKQIYDELVSKDQGGLEKAIPSSLPILLRNADRAKVRDRAYFALSICYTFLERKDLAFEYVKKAYQIAPENPVYMTFYGLGLKMQARNRDARDFYVDMERKIGHSLQFDVMIATIDMSIQDYASSLQIWNSYLNAKQSLSIQDQAVALMQIADCKMHQGNYSSAVVDLSSSLKTLSTVTGNSLLGEAYLKTGRVKECITQFDLALNVNPHYDRALYYKGIAVGATGDQATATELYRRALHSVDAGLKTNDDEGDDHFLRGLIETAYGNRPEAHASFDRARKLGYTYDAPYHHSVKVR